MRTGMWKERRVTAGRRDAERQRDARRRAEGYGVQDRRVPPGQSFRLFHRIILSILNVMEERIHPCGTHKTCKMSTQEVEEQLSIATLGNKDRGSMDLF
ncbi:uncharacterized protein VK521_016122 isoform 2-T2 [Ammospiza maritima maritima]